MIGAYPTAHQQSSRSLWTHNDIRRRHVHPIILLRLFHCIPLCSPLGSTHHQIGKSSAVTSWKLADVKEASTPSTNVAHLYTLDHVLQSIFHYLFYYNYWYLIPHDGRRNANSQAQQDLINLAASRNEIIDPTTQETAGMDELRKALAGEIWRREKVYAGWTLVGGFFLKVGLHNRALAIGADW